jgi:ribosomal protein S18 acetylase RimI-like enzyme
MNYIKINKKKYQYTILDPYQLIKLIREKSKLIIAFEETIKIYRDEPNFTILNLLREYINSDPATETKYSIIHKKKIIISTARFIYDKNKTYINLVYTNPDYRGLKICQNHIRHFINLHNTNNKDNKTYELHVDINNIPAIKCYENIGFENISKNKDNYFMRLELSN